MILTTVCFVALCGEPLLVVQHTICPAILSSRQSALIYDVIMLDFMTSLCLFYEVVVQMFTYRLVSVIVPISPVWI